MSARDLSSGFEDAALAPILRPCVLFEGLFRNGYLRLWDGIGPLFWGDLEFTGAGQFLGIQASEETDDLKASGITVSLKGISPADLERALAERKRYLPCQVWIGALDEAGLLIDDPYRWFGGRMDTVTIDDGTDSAVIKVNYEHELISLENPRNTRYSDQEQKRRFPGDRFFEDITGLQNRVLAWGTKA